MAAKEELRLEKYRHEETHICLYPKLHFKHKIIIRHVFNNVLTLFLHVAPHGQRVAHPTRKPSTGGFKIPPAVPSSAAMHSVLGFLQG